MTETKRLLEARNAQKRRKPLFARRDARNKAKVSFSWRKPRGRHSPVRQKHRGKQRLVAVGYGSPREVKHLHKSGLVKVVVHNQTELNVVNPEKQGIVISQKVGKRKKIELIKLALEKKLTILNLTEPKSYIEKLETKFKERKASRKKKETEKEKKEAEKKKKAEEKAKEDKEKEDKEGEKKTEETPVEEVQKEQKEKKKEQEKTLIKKQ